MLKLLKWDFLNYINRYSRLYWGFAAVLIVAAIIPRIMPDLSLFVDGAALVFGFIFFGHSIYLSIIETVSWLYQDSSQLELSLPVKPWAMLLSKLAISMGILTTGSIFTVILLSVMKRAGISDLAYSITHAGWFSTVLYIFIALALLTTIMFSYISAKSFPSTRNQADSAPLIFFLIYLALLLVVPSFFTVTGIWQMKSFHLMDSGFGFKIAMNESLRWLQTGFNLLYPIAIIASGFWGSCLLFKNRFERY